MNSKSSIVISNVLWETEFKLQKRRIKKFYSGSLKDPSIEFNTSRGPFAYASVGSRIIIPTAGIKISRGAMSYVLAHELGHYYQRHFFKFYLYLAFFAAIFLFPLIYFKNPWFLPLFLVSCAALIFLKVGTMWNEWDADLFGARIINTKRMLWGIRSLNRMPNRTTGKTEVISKKKKLLGQRLRPREYLGK